jgi:2-polyprenyl-3-methyl-5-hydroxy-6-metoxy-1,4-benzoquinol methylase
MQPTPPRRVLHMDEKNWWDFWNTSYRAEDDKDVTSTELFTRVTAVIGQIAKLTPPRILEIACGSGALSRRLSYSSYHGLDISPAAIDIARRKSLDTPRPGNSSTPTYEACDFHDWPLPKEPLDLVLCIDAISCFRDQSLIVRKMADSLRDEGRLVVTTINPFVYNRLKRTKASPIQDGPVSHWLSADELHKLILSAGLTIEHCYTIMPRGNRGILRIINSPRLNGAFGPRAASFLRSLKERIGLGQYRVLVAIKKSRLKVS